MLFLDRPDWASCLLFSQTIHWFSDPMCASLPRSSDSVGGLLCYVDSMGGLPRLFATGGVSCNSPARDDDLGPSTSQTVACCGPEPSEVQLRCGANDAMDRHTGSRGAVPFAPLKPYPIIAILGSSSGVPLGEDSRCPSIRLTGTAPTPHVDVPRRSDAAQ